jgi:hypothetical protein
MAGLLVDLCGAALLARALAFESTRTYIDTVGTIRWPAAGVYAEQDLVHASNSADARVGAILLLAGFVGQFVGAIRSDWSCTVAVIAYAVALLAITAGLIAVPRLRGGREREIFMAHLDRVTRETPDDPNEAAKNRRQIVTAYGYRFDVR